MLNMIVFNLSAFNLRSAMMYSYAYIAAYIYYLNESMYYGRNHISHM